MKLLSNIILHEDFKSVIALLSSQNHFSYVNQCNIIDSEQGNDIRENLMGLKESKNQKPG